FVANLLVVHAVEFASAALDGALDVVLRHIRLIRLVHRQAQTRGHAGVRAAQLCRYGDLLDQTREGFAALRVGRSLPVLDVGPLAVTCHMPDAREPGTRSLPTQELRTRPARGAIARIYLQKSSTAQRGADL